MTQQQFAPIVDREALLAEAKSHAVNFARLTEGIAVLSDFSKGVCHTCSGKFGQRAFALPEYSVDESSPFEDVIFNGIHKDDLLERHILELRFFNFISSVPGESRTHYQMSCIIRLRLPDGRLLPLLHTSRYILWDREDNAWLGLCIYMPLPMINIADRRAMIYNVVTGEGVTPDRYSCHDNRMLSKRQTQILSRLAKGEGSKQIAELLNISVHTVNRHRQDILSALKVTNTASAVEIGLRLHLIQ